MAHNFEVLRYLYRAKSAAWPWTLDNVGATDRCRLRVRKEGRKEVPITRRGNKSICKDLEIGVGGIDETAAEKNCVTLECHGESLMKKGTFSGIAPPKMWRLSLFSKSASGA